MGKFARDSKGSSVRTNSSAYADLVEVGDLADYAFFLQDVRHDYIRAEAMYERAIAADPKHAPALFNYADFLWKVRRDSDRAEAMYERAIKAARISLRRIISSIFL